MKTVRTASVSDGRTESPPTPPAHTAIPSDSSREETNDRVQQDRHLTLAAIYLDQNKDELACYHLGQFVERNPRHQQGRFYLSELLLRLDRTEEALEQYERVIADLQEDHFLDLRHIVHCHGRLVEIAEKTGSDFERQLHRGVALYWLSQVPASTQKEEDEMPVEAILCKAAAALTQAHQLDPDQARPCWYLHNVWHKLGQDQPARRYLNAAQAKAPFSALTPAEHRGLMLVQK